MSQIYIIISPTPLLRSFLAISPLYAVIQFTPHRYLGQHVTFWEALWSLSRYVVVMNVLYKGPTAQGKQRNVPKTVSKNTGKRSRIMTIFTGKFSNTFFMNWTCLSSQLCICHFAENSARKEWALSVHPLYLRPLSRIPNRIPICNHRKREEGLFPRSIISKTFSSALSHVNKCESSGYFEDRKTLAPIKKISIGTNLRVKFFTRMARDLIWAYSKSLNLAGQNQEKHIIRQYTWLIQGLIQGEGVLRVRSPLPPFFLEPPNVKK